MSDAAFLLARSPNIVLWRLVLMKRCRECINRLPRGYPACPYCGALQFGGGR